MPVRRVGRFRCAAAAGLTILIGAACGSSTDSGSASTQLPTTTMSTPGDIGLTAEESLRINPPPPQNVRAQVTGAQVELTWDEPPPVAAPHTYSDRVVGYRVYRRAQDGVESEPVGTSTERSYVDDTVQPGQRYGYQVMLEIVLKDGSLRR